MITVIKLTEKKYERVTLRQLVKKVGLKKLIGSHVVTRIFATGKYSTATVCFRVEDEDNLVYDVRLSVEPSVLPQLGLKTGKSLANWDIVVKIDSDGNVGLDREKNVIGDSAYIWDGRGFWYLGTLEGGDEQ